MAKKNKKRQQPRRTVPQRPAASPAGGLDPTALADDEVLSPAANGIDSEDPSGVGPTVEAAAVPRSGAVEVGRRRVGRVDPAAASGPTRRASKARPGNTAAQFEPLDSPEPAIPFNRVPYVPSDLRRVGAMAALMVGIILVADIIVSHVVK